MVCIYVLYTSDNVVMHVSLVPRGIRPASKHDWKIRILKRLFQVLLDYLRDIKLALFLSQLNHELLQWFKAKSTSLNRIFDKKFNIYVFFTKLDKYYLAALTQRRIKKHKKVIRKSESQGHFERF